MLRTPCVPANKQAREDCVFAKKGTERRIQARERSLHGSCRLPMLPFCPWDSTLSGMGCGMNRMRAALVLAFLPGAALLLAYVWTIVPPEWFAALYGNSAGTGMVNKVAQVIAPCPTPQVSHNNVTVRPAPSRPSQRERVTALTDIPQQSRRPVIVRRSSGEPNTPAFVRSRLHGSYRIGQIPLQRPASDLQVREAYQPAWAPQPERRIFARAWRARRMIPWISPFSSSLRPPVARLVGPRSLEVRQGLWTMRHVYRASHAGWSPWRRSGQRARDKVFSKVPVV
jgi:hypothetical protein